jgi:hypothetical protein
MSCPRRAMSVLICLLLIGSVSFEQNKRAKQAARAGRLGEVITPPVSGERPAEALKVGETAPNFTLPTAADRTKQVTLSSFRGQKPVVLVFGSISWGPLRSRRTVQLGTPSSALAATELAKDP